MSARVAAADARQLELRRVDHLELVADGGDELLDAVAQLAGLVLALEEEDGDVSLDQLEGAVEEVGGVDRAGLDPLHLLKDAGAVVPRLGPGTARSGEDVVRLVLVRGGQLGGARLERLLHLHQQLRQQCQLVDDRLKARLAQLTALVQNRQHHDERQQVEHLRGGVVLGEVGEVEIRLLRHRRVRVTGQRDHLRALGLRELEDRHGLLRRAAQRRDHDDRLRAQVHVIGRDDLRGVDELDRERRAPPEQLRGRQHQHTGTTGAKEEEIRSAAIKQLGNRSAQRVGKGDRAALDRAEAIRVEVQHESVSSRCRGGGVSDWPEASTRAARRSGRRRRSAAAAPRPARPARRRA